MNSALLLVALLLASTSGIGAVRRSPGRPHQMLDGRDDSGPTLVKICDAWKGYLNRNAKGEEGYIYNGSCKFEQRASNHNNWRKCADAELLPSGKIWAYPYRLEFGFGP